MEKGKITERELRKRLIGKAEYAVAAAGDDEAVCLQGGDIGRIRADSGPEKNPFMLF